MQPPWASGATGAAWGWAEVAPIPRSLIPNHMSRNAWPESHGTESKCFENSAAFVSCQLPYLCCECLVTVKIWKIWWLLNNVRCWQDFRRYREPKEYHLNLQEFATNDVCERFFPTETLDGRLGPWKSKTPPEPHVVAEIEGVIGLKAIKLCATVLQCSARLAKRLWDSTCVYLDVPR